MVGLHWGFSLLAALIILSIMVIPYIAKTTENSLRQVPTGYREGAEALGMSMGYGLRKVVLKSALPGIVTGLLLALAIACGETAPLIYTAGLLQHAAALADPRAVPLPDLRGLHLLQRPLGAEALPLLRRRAILVVIVLLLLVSSRIIVARTQRHSESARAHRARRRRSATPALRPDRPARADLDAARPSHGAGADRRPA